MAEENSDEKLQATSAQNEQQPELENNADRISGGSSGSEILCRICFDSSKEEEAVTPCSCKGTVAKVHISCLERWLGTTNSNSCDLCHFRFKTLRRPRYKTMESVRVWLFQQHGSDQRYKPCTDIIVFLIATPALFFCVYTFVFLACDQGIANKTEPTAWATFSLTFFSLTLCGGYYLWLTLSLRKNRQAWYKWWQNNNIVQVLHEEKRPPIITVETSFV